MVVEFSGCGTSQARSTDGGEGSAQNSLLTQAKSFVYANHSRGQLDVDFVTSGRGDDTDKFDWLLETSRPELLDLSLGFLFMTFLLSLLHFQFDRWEGIG